MQVFSLTANPPNGRGCGDRADEAAYLCVGLAKKGTPIYDFILDPALPWDGVAFRGAKTIKRRTGITDVVMWVGAEHYPFVPDFVEEAARYGVSKRIPKNFDFTQVTQLESRLILAHPRVIPDFAYARGTDDDFAPYWCKAPGYEHECAYHLWGLSALEDMGNKHSITNDTDMPDYLTGIECPSFQYNVFTPDEPARDDLPLMVYHTGIFIALPITHVEYVSKAGKVPAGLAKKCEASGLPLACVEE